MDLNEKDLFAIDLFPYRELFKTKQVHAVMIAHACYPMLDLQETDSRGKPLPSSLSFNIVTNLLRGQLGFQGMILTDDLEMGAIVKNYGIGEACRLAVAAGEDMLSICGNMDAMLEGFNSLVRAVEKGEIKEARIDESLTRIAALKSLIQKPLPLETERLHTVSHNIVRLNKRVNYNYGG